MFHTEVTREGVEILGEYRRAEGISDTALLADNLFSDRLHE